jgi:5S rRNA maturation endonuclease (ribonuclease M5)
MDRRDFLSRFYASSLALTGYSFFPDLLTATSMDNQNKSYIEYLRKSAMKKEELDVFLNENSWAQFDPELGYILGNYMPHDGIDESYTISTSMKDGSRTRQVYADKPCRINTYGNSFTQCHQVSDAETWQEYLAGHLGEPIRNFGMGGFGVYQAYRRMLREEMSEHDADYIIFYMWGDDYFRSVFRCRYVTYYTTWDNDQGYMFHGNFWSNIEMDLTTGNLVEKENSISRKEDLYRMTDPDFMVEKLRDDLMVQLQLLSQDKVDSDIDRKGLNRLAEILDVPPLDFSSNDNKFETVNVLKNKYAFEATKNILGKVKKFAEDHHKNLLVIHFDPYGVFKPMVHGIPRYDQEVIEFIRENNINYFDMNEVHLTDFKSFDLSLDEYMKRYFIGHYNPAGNHFFAYALKDRIIEWLEPKPVTYQSKEGRRIRFEGYLDK